MNQTKGQPLGCDLGFAPQAEPPEAKGACNIGKNRLDGTQAFGILPSALFSVDLLDHSFGVRLMFRKMGLEPHNGSGRFLVLLTKTAAAKGACLAVRHMGFELNCRGAKCLGISGFEPHLFPGGHVTVSLRGSIIKSSG